MKPLCRECRDADKKVEADVRVQGVKTLESGKKVPYRGAVCEAHAEYIQADEGVELTSILVIT